MALAVVVAAVALVGFAGPAWAETDLAVDVGYDGYAQSGRPFPVRIEITTDVLITGELRITSRDLGTAVTRPVEIPGGTTRELTLIWEGGPWGAGDATVQLVVGDDVVASATVRPQVPRGDDLVGVFPSLAGQGLPGAAPLSVDAGEAFLLPVDPSTLVAGWAVLAPLDAIVVSGSDLRTLDDAGIDALLGWVNRGGRLLVDEPTGSDIPGVPPAWQPDGDRPRIAGQGEISTTNGNAAAGNWDLLFEPAPTGSRQEEEAFGEVGGFWGAEPLSSTLGRDAGLNLPSTTWLAIVLGSYVAVAGPGVWLLLRTLKRPGLAWLVVPAVALIFTAGIWVTGSSLRSGTQTAHGTIVEVAPRGTLATTYSLLNSRRGGAASVSMPSGWSTVGVYSEGFPAQLDVIDSTAGTEVSVDLDAGGFAVVGGSGPAPELDGALEVSAWSPDPSRVVGTVTNHLAVDLHEVVVFADLAGDNIGTVPAGATVEFDYQGQTSNPFNGEPIEFRVWEAAVPPQYTGNFNREYAPGAVNLGLWGELSARSSFNSRPVGQVVVAAWTDELGSPLDVTVTAGRTLLVARGAIEHEGTVLTNLAVPRQMVRGPSDVGTDFRMLDRWGGGAMIRFVIPDDAEATDLVLTVPRSQQRIDLWDGTQWRQLEVDPGTAAFLTLPPESLDRNRVYVKVLLDFERGLPEFRELAVRSRRPNEEPLPVTYVDNESGDSESASG